MSKEFKRFLKAEHVVNSSEDTQEAFAMIAKGEVNNEDTKEFLLKINSLESNLKNSNLYYLYFYGAFCAFREVMIKIKSPEKTIDVCGTGGDGLKTLNISTAVAFVVAACGIPVAKHGGRAVSSLSGSYDVFKELGVTIELSKEKAEECLEKNNLVFLFAPLYHPAFKNVIQARKELGVKTIFNYLGPLLNPAQPKYQLIGCATQEIATLVSMFAWNNNYKNYAIVYGEDGMDEISISANSRIISKNEEMNFNPEKFGFKKVLVEEIKGNDGIYNAKKLLELLEGKIRNSAYYNIVVLNSALALCVDKEEDFKFKNFDSLFEANLKKVKEAIDSGAALKVLKKLQNFK